MKKNVVIPPAVVWFAIFLLTAGVVMLRRGEDYRSDGTLAGPWDLQMVVGSSLGNTLGWIFVAVCLAILVYARFKTLLWEAIVLTLGAGAVFIFWSKELPGPPFYFWALVAVVGLCIVLELLGKTKPGK